MDQHKIPGTDVGHVWRQFLLGNLDTPQSGQWKFWILITPTEFEVFVLPIVLTLMTNSLLLKIAIESSLIYLSKLNMFHHFRIATMRGPPVLFVGLDSPQ